MKKLLFSLALCAFAASLFAAAPAKPAVKEKVLLEGPLTIVTPGKPYRNQVTKEWVKGWGLAGTAGIANGAVALKDGLIYGYCIQTKVAGKLILTVKASAIAGTANNKLNGYFSTCVRTPGNTAAFRHEKRTLIGPFALTADVKEYKVEYPLAAYEMGYIYLGGNNVNIHSIRVVSQTE